MTNNTSITKGKNTFSLVMITHFIALLGSAIARFGLGVWALQSTGKVSSFAVVLIASFLPGILLSPFVGAAVDSKGPRIMLLTGNILSWIISGIILISILRGEITMVHVIAGVFSLSIVSEIQEPTLQTFIRFLVPEEKFSRAEGVLSTLSSVTSMVGPVLAGIVMGFGGITIIMVIKFATYTLTVLLLLLLWKRLKINHSIEEDITEENLSILKEVKLGFNYLRGEKPLFALVLLFTVLNFALGVNEVIGQPYILSFGTVEQFGLLSSIYGLGMVLGGLLMSLISLRGKIISLILVSMFGMGIFISLTGIFNNVFWIGLFWGGMGLLLSVINTAMLTLIQVRADPKFLGRVFSLAKTFAWISLPFAYLIGGLVADTLVRNNVNITPFLGNDATGIYGMLLFFSGILIIITVIFFSNLKYLKDFERSDNLEK